MVAVSARWNGSCRSRRTWEGIAQDFSNCQGAPRGVFAREERMEAFDEELSRLLEEAIRSHKEDYETYD